jgi:hypothetical protein
VSGTQSIKNARTGAVSLIICNGEQPIVQVALERQEGSFLPIFYKCRSMDVEIGSGKPTGAPRTDMIVFGYARKDGDRTDGTLFALRPDGVVIGCPQSYIDQAAIDYLLS